MDRRDRLNDWRGPCFPLIRKSAVSRDASKPDGTPRKLMDSGKLRAMGWAPRVGLREGIAGAYADFKNGLAA